MSEVQDQNLNSDHLDLKHLDKKTEELLVKKAGEAKEYSYSPYCLLYTSPCDTKDLFTGNGRGTLKDLYRSRCRCQHTDLWTVSCL